MARGGPYDALELASVHQLDQVGPADVEQVGRLLALGAAGRGARVVLWDLDGPAAERVAGEIAAAQPTGTALAQVVDVTDAQAVRTAASRAAGSSSIRCTVPTAAPWALGEEAANAIVLGDLTGGGYEEVALAIMHAIIHDRPATLILNRPNQGRLTTLDDDAVIVLDPVNRDVIDAAIVDEIHVLPFAVVDPVVRYYNQLSVIGAMIADLRALGIDWDPPVIYQTTRRESYRAIVEAVGCAPEEILFLSDVGAELDAARDAGLQTCQVVRDGKTQAAPGHRQVATLAEIKL